MNRHILSGAIAAGFVVACCGRASAQDASNSTTSNSARLQKLEAAVTQLQQENQQLKSQIQAEGPAEAPAPPNGKFDIASSVTSIKIFGDLLMCYRINEGVAAGRDAGDTGQQDRLRYRLHLGTNINVADGWTMGVVLETASIGRGALVTLGGGGFNDGDFAKGNSSTTTAVTSITTTSSGVVTAITAGGKTVTGTALTGAATKTTTVVSKVNYQDSLFVGQVFLKYQPFDWATIEVGKFRPNLVSTRMIWDADICPEGLGENFIWHFGGASGAHGPEGPAGYDKDGKESKMVAPAPGISFDLFANFGQYLYDDAGFENTFNSGSGTAASPFTQTPDNTSNWLLGFQVGGKVNFTPSTYFQIAPTYYCYTEGGSFSNTGFFNGDNALVIVNKNATTSLLTFNQTSTNNLGIIDVPVEFGSKIGSLPFTIFGDFADNLYASERAANAGHPDKGNEGIAWQAGLSIGQIKHKGDWEIRGWYQRSEQFALDPNLVDDDIFDGRLNMQGIYLKATYALAEAVTFSLEYSNGHRIDSSLGTAGVGQLGTAAGFPLQSVNFVYASFGLKF
jgi:outer membrane murein-binding lipoprotein Lpp